MNKRKGRPCPCIVRGGGPFASIVKRLEGKDAPQDEEGAIRTAARKAGVDKDLFYYFRSEAQVEWLEPVPGEQPKQLLLFK